MSGGYGNWSLNISCNVKCGEGFETWIRQCDKPEPKYGGRNCSHLGESVEYRHCSKKPCIGKCIVAIWDLFDPIEPIRYDPIKPAQDERWDHFG